MKKMIFIAAVAAMVSASAFTTSCQAQPSQYKEIVLPSPEGKDIRLSETVKANKYTLLDFWASWCGPCIGEVPYLVETYKRFHDKGFEIYAVSYDEDRTAWLQMISTKNMNWIHVSALKGWGCPTQADYGINSIPRNFLIDSKGQIVATNLRGEALSEKLAELLK